MFKAKLISSTSTTPGEISVSVEYKDGTDVRVVPYSLKTAGNNATRHALKAIVVEELARLNAASREAVLLAARIGADISTLRCDCGLPGCPLDGRHWLRAKE